MTVVHTSFVAASKHFSAHRKRVLPGTLFLILILFGNASDCFAGVQGEAG